MSSPEMSLRRPHEKMYGTTVDNMTSILLDVVLSLYWSYSLNRKSGDVFLCDGMTTGSGVNNAITFVYVALQTRTRRGECSCARTSYRGPGWGCHR